jgi:hypothetical protein
MTERVALYRVPGAVQHAVMRCRTGTQLLPSNMGPASAEQRCTLYRAPDTRFVP